MSIDNQLLEFNEGLKQFIDGDFSPGLYLQDPPTYLIGMRVDTNDVCIFVIPESSEVVLVIPNLVYPETDLPVSYRIRYRYSMLETLDSIREFLTSNRSN